MMRLTQQWRKSLPEVTTETMLMDLVIPSDAYALELAKQINVEYGLDWIPEYVQYLATKLDLLLDDNLMDHLSLFANHQLITTNV
jgi:hypothetical protein